MKPARIVVLGYEYFAKKIVSGLRLKGVEARFLSRRFSLGDLLFLFRADLIYCIGGRVSDWKLRIFQISGKKIVMHWVGTDVEKFAREKPGTFTARCRHLTEDEQLREELSQNGMRAEVCPIAAIEVPENPPRFPAGKFAVLAYVPETREEFYGRRIIEALAETFSDIVFHICANTGKNWRKRPNVKFFGWVKNMSEQIRASHILIRPTRHDGVSFMVLEALAHGRYVIWSRPFPSCFLATESEEFYEYVAHLFRRWKKGEMEINEAGRQYVKETFEPGRVYDGLIETLLEERNDRG